jgi:hypothetical protein
MDNRQLAYQGFGQCASRGHGSQAWQEEFVSILLNFKRDGHYLDVGSNDYAAQNNSYVLEHILNWKGICIEIGPQYAEGYKNRNCHFINADATQVDYKAVFESLGYPSRLDYLSLDCDDSSLPTLQKLPLDDYRFNTITIEHDAYRVGNIIRDGEREILKKFNYVMLVEDVFAPLGCGMGPNLPFEDWWVDPAVFNMDKIRTISASGVYPDEIVGMLRKRDDVYLL